MLWRIAYLAKSLWHAKELIFKTKTFCRTYESEVLSSPAIRLEVYHCIAAVWFIFWLVALEARSSGRCREPLPATWNMTKGTIVYGLYGSLPLKSWSVNTLILKWNTKSVFFGHIFILYIQTNNRWSTTVLYHYVSLGCNTTVIYS